MGVIVYSPFVDDLIFDENYAKKHQAQIIRIQNHIDKLLQNPEFASEIQRINDSLQFSQKEALFFRKENDLKNSELKLQKRISTLFVVSSFMLLLLVGIAFRSYHQKLKDNQIIQTQKHLVEVKNREILDSIEYAKRIQTAILPPARVVHSFFKDSFILYLPKDIVAGDFYWMEEAEGRTYFAACDCTGHGVPGAMVSVVCNTALNRAITEMGERLPGKILDRTREMVLENFSKSDDEVKDGMDASLACLLPDQKTLLWAGANNPLWIYRAGMRNIEEIKADKQPVGQSDQVKPFSTHEISVSPGDIIYLFTDGYADQFGGEHNRKLTRRGFKELLLSMADRAMDEQRSLLHEYLIQYRGTEEQIDDVCVMGVRVI
jgi:serine phosphatase RsbU (regulator of sigma subunit)